MSTVGLALRGLACWLTVATVASAAPAAAEPRTIPESRVVIDLPEEYTAADRFAGFTHPSGASFVIVDMPPEAFPELKAGLSSEGLNARGIKAAEVLNLTRSDNHVAFKGVQETAVGDYHKYIVVLGDRRSTAMITANVPQSAIDGGRVKADQIVAALSSIKLGERAPAAKPRYELGYTGPLKPAGSFAGVGQIYTPTGTLPKEKLTKSMPSVIVVHSLVPETVFDPYTTTQALLKGLRGYKDLSFGEAQNVRTDGLGGYAHEGEGVSEVTGDKIRIYHVVLFEDEGGYYRIIATTPESEAATVLPELKKMAESFKRTQ